jgi:hypothetical protein
LITPSIATTLPANDIRTAICQRRVPFPLFSSSYRARTAFAISAK